MIAFSKNPPDFINIQHDNIFWVDSGGQKVPPSLPRHVHIKYRFKDVCSAQYASVMFYYNSR